MSDTTQANAKHHFVQRAYLDRFADNRRLDVISRVDGTVQTNRQTSDVATIRGLYTVMREDGVRDGSLEAAFETEIENPGLKVITNMTSVFPYVPRGKERSILAYYMAFQYMRTLEAKRRFEADAGRLASIELFNTSNDPDKIKELLTRRGEEASDQAVREYQEKLGSALNSVEITPHANMWLASIKAGIDRIAPILAERYYWHLYYCDRPTFVTSDHPVVLRKIYPDPFGVGFGTADEVMFPLSKNHALILSTDPDIPEGIHIEPEQLAVEMVNYFVTHGSYLEIYAHPLLTKEFSGKGLGQRPIVTMDGGFDDPQLAFLRKYVGVLERPRPHR